MVASVIAVAVALGIALFPASRAWADGFEAPVLAQLGAQTALALSAGLLAMTPEHRRAAVLLALGVLAIGVTNLDRPHFESWGYAVMVGFATALLPAGLVLPVLLTFPGRTLDRLGRFLVGALWIGAILWRVVSTPTWDPAWGGYTGPARWLTYPGLESPDLSDALRRMESITLVVLGLISIVAFVRRWRSAHGLARVVVRVVAVSGIGLSVAVPLNVLRYLLPAAGATAAYVVQNLVLLVMPLGVLSVSVWSALQRGSLVEALTARAGDARGVQEVLAAELRDPHLRVHFRRPTSWLDVAGGEVGVEMGAGEMVSSPGVQPNPPYAAALGRHWEFLRAGSGAGTDDAVVAAIDLADDALTDPGRVGVALAAAALVLDNTRLAVEREAHLAELTAAQSRIVEAGLAERRRLERDLHDGAQQQILAVSTTLSRARLLAEPERVRAVVDEARDQLATALSELRSLAHGIHPGVLSQGGLAAGLEPLVRVDPRVSLDLDPALRHGRRLAADVESAAYFVATEGLANAVKHSGATAITVSAGVEPDPARLCLSVSDDGGGGAAASGGGLRGLADRVAALGGTFTVTSPPGGGTLVHACLPGSIAEAPAVGPPHGTVS